MERDNDKTDLLLETIRNELVAIIDEKESEIDENGPKKNNQEIKSPQTYPPPYDNTSQSGSDLVRRRRKCWTTLGEGENTTSSSSSSRSSPFLDAHNTLTIDEDLKNMSLNLNESYELLHSVGDRFENINFGCLKSRIKDLRLNERSSESIKTIVNDLKNAFDDKYMENRLNDLTKEVTTKFRNHPGEFGDIPEISEFFKTCTQLQHGLEKLQKQRNDVQDLTNRMTRVAEASYERVTEIQKNIQNDRGESKSMETIGDSDAKP